MIILPCILLLMPLLPLLIPQDAYDRLRLFPKRHRSRNPILKLRYYMHVSYFQYLVTGPGYMLAPTERMLLDAFVLLLLGTALYLTIIVAPPIAWFLSSCGTGILSQKIIVSTAAGAPQAVVGLKVEVMWTWDIDMRHCIQTVGNVALLSVAGNGTFGQRF
jgi:hypothetical protein